MIADLTGYGVRTPTANPGRAVRTGGLAEIADPMVGMVAYWKFDTAASRVTPDATGHGNDLTFVGPTGGIQNTTWKLGGGAYGPGSFSDGVQRVETTNLVPGPSGSFTMQNWCNRSVTVGTFTIMGRCRTAAGGSGDLDFRMGAYGGVQLHRVFEFAVKSAAGQRYTVQFLGVTMEEAVWYHVCCGYNAALQQIWIQVNGAQRQVLNGVPDVRVTIPNFTMMNDMDLSSAASCCAEEAGFWSRSLNDGEVVMLYNSGNGRAYPFVGTVPPSRPSVVNTFADAWAWQVQINGGANPSAPTKTAVNAFVDGCITDGLWGLIQAVNVFAPDSLVAAITPLKATPGVTLLWANTAFVGGDLSVNGLQGDGSTKSLNSGVTPAVMFPSASDAGGSVYTMSGSAGMSFGTVDTPFVSAYLTSQSLAALSSGSTCWGFAVGVATAATIPAHGFSSFSRDANNSHKYYFANSSNPLALLNTATAVEVQGSSGLTDPVIIFNADNKRMSWPCNAKISFVAFHKALTLAQTAALYARVQTLRTALGGGFL